MKDYTKGEIVKIILLTLLAAGAFTLILAMPGLAQIYKLFDAKTPEERRRIRRAIHRMENRKLVQTRGAGDDTLVYLKRKGEVYAKLEKATITPQKKWDGLWRVVAFDIPEKRKSARRALSNKLQDMGCQQFQKSVFISPYPCRDEVCFVADVFRVRRYIRYIKATEVEGEKLLKKKFGL